MDDLKVIFYVVVAIIWVVYNNYKKISEASKKRNISLPPEKTAPPYQKTDIPKSVPAPRTRRETIEKQPRKIIREVLSRKQTPAPALIKSKQISERPIFNTSSFRSEGGTIAPSGIVKFEDPVIHFQAVHPVLQALRTTDLRTAFVMGEVLKRPYN